VAETWRDRTLDSLLTTHGLSREAEEPFPTDGWSGAHFGYFRSGDGPGFVLKRDALAHDWLGRALLDIDAREAEFVDRAVRGHLPFLSTGPGPLHLPYLGAASDGDESAILMPDLSMELLAWERPGHELALDPAIADLVIDAVARLHTLGWWIPLRGQPELPWCPLRERITLLTPGSAERYRAEGNSVGDIFLAGWGAFARQAPGAARELIERLDADPGPLLSALGRLPAVGIHGDLKLSNVAVFDDQSVAIIDWQMIMKAPVAVELGWLLVSNVAVLPYEPRVVIDAYRRSLRWHVNRWAVAGFNPLVEEDVIGDPEETADLAWIVGLLLRGWRKGRDAETGVTLASGVPAAEDLAWWCERAVKAATRRL
jgi:hypothetical protein